ncbi:MotA/TolQ/ExbB proton channel family protein [Rhodocyclus tenuis]|uniref:Biopolymer transport protein ExbB n=1 Tax=Rhodocyclus tenuis TaxID=1066 RepID=A0A840G8D8_RHOTE|nr:MotA/TolQ/ExbB proton channel family protein [Rhodocyclus tenuis]MBB4247691.1 biopolymer transport protein ExbB [Rhodocyclus tenuis]
MDPTVSPYGLAALWSQGDLAIRGVALLLLLMSIASWWLIVTRTWRLIKLRRAARASAAFWHCRSFAEGLQALQAPGTPDAELNPFHLLAVEGKAAVAHHTEKRQELHGQLNLAEWLGEALRGAIDDSAERLRSGLSVLASVGSTAPFIGLFGTVWGIYHALVGIGMSGQASIDQVAGPVGEALIMTAFGLVVAIPAVLGYNALNRANRALTGQLRRFARQLHAYFLTGSPLDSTTEPAQGLSGKEAGGVVKKRTNGAAADAGYHGAREG